MKSEFLFVSDIHLSSTGNLQIIPAFTGFLEQCVKGTEHLYILGDLFDFWGGDHQLDDDLLQPVIHAMRGVADAGTSITLLPGNRDFLLGRRAARRLGAERADEVVEIERQGLRLFLTHGDLFCTFDVRYQRMKRVLRSPVMLFLARSIPSTVALAAARRLRKHSSRVKQMKTSHETSLDKQYIQHIAEKGVDAIICGHVHSSADEELAAGGRLITLSDWSAEGGSYVELAKGKLTLKFFSP